MGIGLPGEDLFMGLLKIDTDLMPYRQSIRKSKKQWTACNSWHLYNESLPYNTCYHKSWQNFVRPTVMPFAMVQFAEINM